jgi:hypothetical protein
MSSHLLRAWPVDQDQCLTRVGKAATRFGFLTNAIRGWVLGAFLPHGTARANRYYCVWEDTGDCGFNLSCGLARMGKWQRHCCYDDYTGQRVWCDSERLFGCDC